MVTFKSRCPLYPGCYITFFNFSRPAIDVVDQLTPVLDSDKSLPIIGSAYNHLSLQFAVGDPGISERWVHFSLPLHANKLIRVLPCIVLIFAG